MLLNLPDLTDEAFMLSRSNPGYAATGTADTKTPPTGTWVPQATVGTSTNQALYIGPNGAWGYAQAGTGTGAGGNGIAVGTIGWVPASQYNPVAGGTSTPPLPPAPTLPPNIPALLDYIPALEVIFKTATDVLSGHPQTNAKRSVLQNTQSQLVSAGRVVQEYGLYDVMQASLSGVYKSAYVAGGKLASATAVQLGWKLAQDLAKSGISTKLQVFESSLVAAIHGAERLNGKTLTAAQSMEIRTTVQGLARNYARLNPLPEQSLILEGYQAKGIDALWNFQSFAPATTNGLISSDGILQYLKTQFQGQSSPSNALQFVDKLVQATTRVEKLHQKVNGDNQFPRYIQYGGFLRELTELGFEITRVNPTVTAGNASVASEWIENLLEESGNGNGLRLATEGLAQLFDGFKVSQSDGIEKLGQTLDYQGRLVKVAEAVDGDLDSEVLKAGTLSHLMNLGGAYAALKPNQSSTSTFFLDVAWQNSAGLIQISDQLETFLKKYPGLQPRKTLELSKNTLWVMSNISPRENSVPALSAQIWIQDVLSYTSTQMSLRAGESILNNSEIIEGIQVISTRQSAVVSGVNLYSYITPESIQVASNNLNNLIAQEDIGGALQKGLWEIVVGGFLILLDSAGKVVQAVLHSNSDSPDSGQSEQTRKETLTDEAIAEILKGSIPTDENGEPLKPGESHKPNRRVENYEKPDGDINTQQEDLQKLANRTGGTIKDQPGANDEGTVSTVALPDATTAAAYPRSRSGDNSPSLQISKRSTPNSRRTIKIRYTKGRNGQARLLIPTTPLS